MSGKTNKKLGEILIEKNVILPEHLNAALERQKRTDRRLGQLLIEMGFASRDDVLNAIADQSGVPHVWLRKGLVDPGIVRVIPREKAHAYSVIPMFRIQRTLTLGMADASNVVAIDDIERITGLQVQVVQCRNNDIEAAIREYYSEAVEMGDFLESLAAPDIEVEETPTEDLRMVQESAEGARIINLVNLILLNAVKAAASDIHIEPDIRVTRVRYRIDGALQETMTPRGDVHSAIVSRVKVMAKMDIAERRLPQDGRIRVAAEGRSVDLRVSTMPTVLGEKVVMRLLDKGNLSLDINDIGVSREVLPELKKLLGRPNGILLVTGPTGSGKTTTLYASLSFVSSVERNIVTIEDPVEYQLPLINQIQVQEEQGLSFVRVLRSVLRQDPDIIMVGEIRDRQTAEVSIQAALTGHLVLATLHTNDSVGAITRLAEMGIEPFLLTSSLIGVIGQRLIRRVCPNCRTNHFPPRELLDRIGWKGSNSTFVTGRGCEECFDSGLRGRSGVFELLTMTDELRSLVVKDPSVQTLRAFCRRSGMRTMKDEAFRLVESRETSLEEVLRVILVEETAEEPVERAET